MWPTRQDLRTSAVTWAIAKSDTSTPSASTRQSRSALTRKPAAVAASTVLTGVEADGDLGRHHRDQLLLAVFPPAIGSPRITLTVRARGFGGEKGAGAVQVAMERCLPDGV
jgi:hypothetical protein